jgi:hypothetical protein
MRDVVRFEKGEDDGEIPPPPSKLFHERDYVMRTWLEHKIHHTYPDRGGYNDQDEYLMRDWHTMNVYYMRVHAGEFAAVLLPDDTVDWDTLLGE